jgi:hypothetical protein
MNGVLDKLNSSNTVTATQLLLPLAIELAKIPESIKGFGHVKEKSVAAARLKWDALLKQF